MKKSTLLAMVMAVLCLMGCGSKKESKISFGEYFYVDSERIIHSNRECNNIAEKHGAKPVEFIKLKYLGSCDNCQCCSRCLNNKDHEYIESQCHVYKNRNEVRNVVYDNDYTYMYGSRADIEDWLDQIFVGEKGMPRQNQGLLDFSDWIEESDDNCRQCYDSLQSWGYSFYGDTYEEFKQFVGVK